MKTCLAPADPSHNLFLYLWVLSTDLPDLVCELLELFSTKVGSYELSPTHDEGDDLTLFWSTLIGYDCNHHCVLLLWRFVCNRHLFPSCLLSVRKCNRFCMMQILYNHVLRTVRSRGSHGSLSLPFVMKVKVWCFLSDSHKVMAATVVILPSRCWCQDFSGIS
jgi:hypothetical protein